MRNAIFSLKHNQSRKKLNPKVLCIKPSGAIIIPFNMLNIAAAFFRIKNVKRKSKIVANKLSFAETLLFSFFYCTR